MPLQPVWHQACSIGLHLPVWDIHDKFGDTNMLVTNLAQGADLAKALGDNKVALMRGHGFAVTGNHLQDAVSTAIYLPKNARILTTAKLLGGTVTMATPGEVAKAGPGASRIAGVSARLGILAHPRRRETLALGR